MGRSLRQDRPSDYLVQRVDELIRLSMANDLGRIKFARKRLLQYLARIEQRADPFVRIDQLIDELPDDAEPIPEGDLA